MSDVALEAEAHLISAAFKDPTIRTRCQVTSEQFQDLSHRIVWEAMGVAPDFDVFSVGERMTAQRLERIGGFAYLSGLMDTRASTANVDFYAAKVRDAYLKHEVQSKVSDILMAGDDVSGEELYGRLTSVSHALTGSLSSSNRTLGMAVEEEREWAISHSGEARGLPMGLGIDGWIPGGIPRKKVMTLFADTGSFKTTVILQTLFKMASDGHRGLLVPLEDGDDLTAHRWLARMTGVPYGRIAGGVCNDAERHLIEKVKPVDWAFLDNVVSADGIEPRIDAIIREVASLHARGGLDFVIVDYMQLLEGYGKQMDVISDAMRKAANAAKRYNVVWIFLSQQNDRNDDRKSPRPTLKDMYGGASMKQMSKTVLALFRPSEHWPHPVGDTNKLWGMYSRFVARHPKGPEIYKNIVELWCLKSVLSAKTNMRTLIAKPDVGILDPVDLRRWM